MRARRVARTVALVTAAVSVAALATACGSEPESSAPATSATATPSPTPTPTPSPTSLLSGRPLPDGRVLALKIDNTGNSLPHIGLREADVVYVQQVEGGLSRLAAVYSTTLPERVGPIRSARETDAELLPMYGPIAFGFSGSVSRVHRLVRAAGLIDVSADKGPVGYARLRTRSAPYNEVAFPSRLIARAGGSVPARDVGFRFGAAPAGGTVASRVTTTFPSARVRFTYDPRTGLWVYSLGGRVDRSAQGTVAASTVIVQSVRLSLTGRDDVAGNPVPKTRTVGSGKALVLRDGKAWPVTWSRADTSSPTRWIYRGRDFPLKAGQVWVVLLDQRRSAVVAAR